MRRGVGGDPAGLGENDGEAFPGRARSRSAQSGAGHVDIPFGEAVEQLVEGDLPLEPGEARAEAEVQAEPEREVL